jgi:hypothetical protein
MFAPSLLVTAHFLSEVGAEVAPPQSASCKLLETPKSVNREVSTTDLASDVFHSSDPFFQPDSGPSATSAMVCRFLTGQA